MHCNLQERLDVDAVIESPPKASRATPTRLPGKSAREERPCDPLRYLTFQLGSETCCVDILHVQEIRGYSVPTRIANAPPAVKGVLNLRGSIVPVVDLRQVFGLADVRHDAVTATIVIAVGQRRAGVVVDSVADVLELQPEQISAPPLVEGTRARDSITGLACVKTGDASCICIVLDIERLLANSGIGLA